MPRDPKKTWEQFAAALAKEEDAEKFKRLTQQLYDALVQDEEQQNPRTNDTAAE